MEIEKTDQDGHNSYAAGQTALLSLAVTVNRGDHPETDLFDMVPLIDFTDAPAPDILEKDILDKSYSTADSFLMNRKASADADPSNINEASPDLGLFGEEKTCGDTQALFPFPDFFGVDADRWTNCDNCQSFEEALAIKRDSRQQNCSNAVAAQASAKLLPVQPSEISAPMKQQVDHQFDSGGSAKLVSPERPSNMTSCCEKVPHHPCLSSRPPHSVSNPTSRSWVCPVPVSQQSNMHASVFPQAPYNPLLRSGAYLRTPGYGIGTHWSADNRKNVTSSKPTQTYTAKKRITKPGKKSKPENGLSKAASPSRYCHICGRRSRADFSHCRNIKLGTCRKVICKKCVLLFDAQNVDMAFDSNCDWKCTHCRSECPDRARCTQYTKNNQIRRERKAKERAERERKEESSKHGRAELKPSFARPMTLSPSHAINQVPSALSSTTDPDSKGASARSAVSSAIALEMNWSPSASR